MSPSRGMGRAAFLGRLVLAGLGKVEENRAGHARKVAINESRGRELPAPFLW